MTLTSQLTHKHLANPTVDREFQVQPKSTPTPHMIFIPVTRNFKGTGIWEILHNLSYGCPRTIDFA
jgi:hypothetical protein